MKVKIDPPVSLYEIGNRPNQEDALFPEPGKATENNDVFVLCDGMGGHADGEKASRVVADTLGQPDDKSQNFTIEDFESKLNEAYDRLDEADNGEARKMGTTFCYLRFNNAGCLVAHMGDSRIYHIRPKERQILYKSKDHSLVQSLYDLGEITRKEMKNHPQKNIVTRVMQPNLDVRHKPEIKQLTDLQEGDIIYMCSDGMLERMEDEDLIQFFADPSLKGEKITDALREATNGNNDNHSAWIIRIREIVEETTSKDNETTEQVTPTERTVTPKRQTQKKRYLTFWFILIVSFIISLIYSFLF